MLKSLYLKNISKKWILIVCLIAPALMGNEDEFDQDNNNILTLTGHKRYDVEVRAPYYMLSIKPKNQNVFQPFKIYDIPIAIVEWHNHANEDILIVTFANRKHSSYTLTSKKKLINENLYE